MAATRKILIVGKLVQDTELVQRLKRSGTDLVFAKTVAELKDQTDIGLVFLGPGVDAEKWVGIFPSARFILLAVRGSLPRGCQGQVVSPGQWEVIDAIIRNPFELAVDKAIADVLTDRIGQLPKEAGVSEEFPKMSARETTVVLDKSDLPTAESVAKLENRQDGGLDVEDSEEKKDSASNNSLGDRVRKRMRRLSTELFPEKDSAAVPPRAKHDSEVDLRAIGEDISAFDDVDVSDNSSFRATGTLAQAGFMRLGVSDAAVLLAKARRDQLTGKITFSQGEIEKSVVLQDGWVVFAETNLEEDRMGRMLVREGKVTQAVVENALEVTADRNIRLGEALVEIAGIKAKELRPAVRRHLMDIVCSLFAWSHGQYEVVSGDFFHGESIRMDFQPAALIAEGIRRKFPAHDITSILGGADATMQIADAGTYRLTYTFVVENTDMTVREREAIRLLLSSRSLSEVAAEKGLPVNVVAMLAYGLFVLGVAVPRDWQDTPLPAILNSREEDETEIDRRRIHDKIIQVATADYFAILGVEPAVTGYELLMVLNKRLAEFTLDKFSESVQKELASDVQTIRLAFYEAFEVLSHPLVRPGYQQYK